MSHPNVCAVIFVVASLFSLGANALGQSREDKVRNDRLRVSKSGLWHYNDLDAGFEEALRTNKPLMVVFRCIPCVECVKLDDDLLEQNDSVVESMRKFVRVRQISTNGIDLNRYQFDFDQSFSVMFFHPDGTLLGRFGTRSHHTEWENDVSIAGLGAAMKQVLEWHSNFDSVRDSLAKKQSTNLKHIPVASPEKYPTLERFPPSFDLANVTIKNCIHCHQVGEAQKSFALSESKTESLPMDLLFPYPHPKILGLILDVDTCATVKEVVADSIAHRAGFKAGDKIVRFDDQPIISLADLQWVLHLKPNTAIAIPVTFLRDGKSTTVSLNLSDDWKASGDISWRASSWELRRLVLGGMVLKELDKSERQKLGIADGAMALGIGHVGQYAPHNRAKLAGLQKEDVVVSVLGKKNLTREVDIIRFLLDQRQTVKQIPIDVLRAGKPMSFELK